MSVALESWLASFLKQRPSPSGQLPDGRPLFGYRCNGNEFETLQQLLRERLRGRLDNAMNSATAAAVCLFAAEWWRRHYYEGGWTWKGVLDALGVSGDVPHAHLAQLTDRGLRFWGRRVRERGGRQEYLLSLALEAGMPLRLVERPDTHVGRFLLRLIQDLRDFPEPHTPSLELAQRSRHVLPTSLQNEELLTLSAELAAGVVLLQRQVHGEEDPYQALDARVPEWREQLPLNLHQTTAEILLRSLIQAAHDAPASHRDAQVTTRLLPAQQGYRIERAITLPRRLAHAGFAHLLKQTELPARLQLIALARDGTRQHLARLTQHSDTEYLVETSHGTSVRLSGDAWLGPVLLSAWSAGQELGRHVIPHGEELDALPWLFVPAPHANEIGTWRLAGTGSGRFRIPEVLLAVPGDVTMKARSPGTRWEHLGSLVQGREVFRVHGDVELTLEDIGICQVRTAADRDEAQRCRLDAEPVKLLPGVEAYLGVPSLRMSFSTGVEQRRERSELEYRSDRTKTWRRVDGACLGDVSLRYTAEGALHFQTQACVLPPSTTLRMHPEGARQGRLRLSGLGAATVKVPPVPHVQADVLPRGMETEILLRCAGEAPDHVPLDLAWPGGQSCTLRVPFPRQLVGFTDISAQPLPDGTLVPLGRLGRVRALVRTPQFQASAELEAAPSGTGHDLDPFLRLQVSLRSTAPGTLELNLGELEPALAMRLASFGDLDACYELRLRVRGVGEMRPAVLRVGRYDLRLEPEREQLQVRLADGDLAGAPAPENLTVEVRPLAHPMEPARELVRIGSRAWNVPTDLGSGPWLVTGREGSWYRTRPLLWSVHPGEEKDGAPVLGPLQNALCISNPERRKAELDAALASLGGNANHPDWHTLLAYLRTLGTLPPETFDAVRLLVEHPQTAVTALFLLSEPDRGRVWSLLEELPFQWPLVPMRAWLGAAQAWLGSASALPPDQRVGVEPMLRERFRSVCELAKSRFGGLEAIAQRLAHKLLLPVPAPPAAPGRESRRFVLGRQQDARQSSPTVPRAPTIQAVPPRELLDLELQELRRTHADTWWPSVANYARDFETPLRSFPARAQRHILGPLQGIRESLPLLNGPVLAALAVVHDRRLSHETQFAIRILRELHPCWFSFAFGYVASICLNEEE